MKTRWRVLALTIKSCKSANRLIVGGEIELGENHTIGNKYAFKKRKNIDHQSRIVNLKIVNFDST